MRTLSTSIDPTTTEPTYKEETKEWNEEKIISILVDTQESLDADVVIKSEAQKAMEFYAIWKEIYEEEGV